MTYLILEMLACLLVAFLLGLLVGWWLGRHRRRNQTGRLEEKWRLKHAHGRRRLEDCREELEACRRALDSNRTGLAKELDDDRPDATADDDRPDATAAGDVDHSAAWVDAAPAEKDDLKKIEGIGPKIEGLLNAGGIGTWSQLAAADTELLRSLLDEAGPRYRVHDPTTWPQQAGLAAAGAWDELAELQGRLKGGRKT